MYHIRERKDKDSPWAIMRQEYQNLTLAMSALIGCYKRDDGKDYDVIDENGRSVARRCMDDVEVEAPEIVKERTGE